MRFGEPSTATNTTHQEIMERAISFEALRKSTQKCKKGVIWKDSVASFVLNDLTEIGKLSDSLHDGTYKSRPGRRFTIYRPKRREAMSISFRDRVYQRSLNDNILYPELTRRFVYDNAACQKNKGTDFCRNRLKCHLQRFYRKHGTQGYILQCDISGYYPNMKHEVAENIFRQYFDEEIAEQVIQILRTQYGGDIGYFPGSQLLQLVGIAALNGIDHFSKEKLHIRHYIRYMDDFLLIHENKEYLEKCRREIDTELGKIGMHLHPKKTRIIPITNNFKFLGFIYRLTKTGKVLMFVNPQTIKEERQRLRKMARLVKKGRMTREKYEECYQSWRAYAVKGSSHDLVKRMDRFHKDLLL